MKSIFRNIAILLAALAVTASCGSDEAEQEVPAVPDTPNQEDRIPFKARAVSEEGGDQSDFDFGLYMSNYVGTTYQELLSKGNYIDNMKMTCVAGEWTSEKPFYWYDATTLADIYAYASYISTIEDCRHLNYALPIDQSNEEAMLKADFLWGRAVGQSPSANTLSIVMSHMFSKVTVTVKPDDSFAEGELKAEDLSVDIGGTKVHAVIDMMHGSVAVDGSPTAVKACNNGDLTFTAILLPQSLGFVNLIRVTRGDDIYSIQGSITFEPRKTYNLSVTIGKEGNSSFNVTIGAWEIDDKDYGGTVE